MEKRGRTRIVKKIRDNRKSEIDKIYYINLEHRKDRKESIVKEIKKIDPEFKKTERINAVLQKPGWIGCGKSHILALEDALEKGYDNVLIFEDDFIFQVENEKILHTLKNFLKEFNDYNLFLLGSNLGQAREEKGDFIKVVNGQTASGYMINKKFVPVLLQNFREAVKALEEGKDRRRFAIDIHWKKFQGVDGKVYTTKKRLGKQMGSFSDIENINVNYGC